MLHQTLGRTGLNVSIASLGCGGPSRLGLRTGHDQAHAASIVDLAINLGINTIDTAESYGTEPAVGRALRNHDRSKVIIATKKSVRRPGPFRSVAAQPQTDTEDAWRKRHDARPFITPQNLRTSIEHSLRKLRTEYIDIYFLHAVLAHELDHAHHHLLPELHKLRDQGKLRFTALSEMFHHDTAHRMLRSAIPATLEGDGFDVVMVGFNILNQSAREPILRPIHHNLRTAAERTTGGQPTAPGVMGMFSVRKALRTPEKLLETLENLHANHPSGAHHEQRTRLARTIAEHPDVRSLPDAAYRLCAHEPGIHTVLTGTGDPEHLKANVRSITAPPLTEDLHAAILRTFAGLDTASAH